MLDDNAMFASLPGEMAAETDALNHHDGDWQIVLPVPANASRVIPSHSLGKPKQKWVYRNKEGQPIFIVCRFDQPKERKQFLPLTFWQHADGRQEWRWKGVPFPRPLYGLDHLAARPDAPVIICEGEKSAEAAAMSFPDHVCITSPNGAASANKADWSPLTGRNVTIWPDHDDEGMAYAATVAQLALAAGAASVRKVSIPNIFPIKWDLADLLPAEVTTEDLRCLLDQATLVTTTINLPVQIDAWQPDMSILHENRRAAPTLPLEVFGAWQNWLKATAEATSSPVDYVAGCLLTLAASLIGNSRWGSPWSPWEEPSAIWMALVGSPSSGKSPAMSPLRSIAQKLERELSKGYESDLLRWRTEAEAARCRKKIWEQEVEKAAKSDGIIPIMDAAAVEPEKPVRPRLVVSDTTPEALCTIMAGQPRGILSYRDEMAGWLGSFNRYSNGSGERPFWLEAYGGRPYILDRVKLEKPLNIPHLTISVLGGIQPDRLASILMTGDDDGFAARMLMMWPEPVILTRPKQTPDDECALEALRKLLQLTMQPSDDGTVTPMLVIFTSEAAELFEQWRKEHRTATASATGLLAGHYGKMPGLLIRIALVLEYLWWSLSDTTEPPLSISCRSVAAAASLLNDYFGPMAERCYGDAALPESDRLATTLARWIIKKRPASINVRDLYRKARLPGLNDSAKVKVAIGELVNADWLQPCPARNGSLPGRTREDFLVNPAIWQVQHD